MAPSRQRANERVAKEVSIQRDPLSEVASLSLTARLGVALNLFRGYCHCRGINHPEVCRFIEYLWTYVALPGGGVGFEDWYFGRPDLAEVAIGYDWAPGFADYLQNCKVNETEFREALTLCYEVIYGSLYAAADDAGSLRNVAGLAAIAVPAGAVWPDLSVFASSPWVDGGWGVQVTAKELAQWRTAVQWHVEPT
jgi:hypothetical protein